MEWLQSLEDLLNDLYFAIQYSKIFAVAIGIAFLVIFGGLIIINSNIHELKNQVIQQNKDIEYITQLLEKVAKRPVIKGETGNGTNDERGDEGYHSGS